MKYNVAIIGGGITGLTVAHRLHSLKQQKNLPINIVLLESAGRLGGVIKSEIYNDFVIEHGPDAFLTEKKELQNLLYDLNLNQFLLPTIEANRQAFIARKNRLIPLPPGFFLIAPTRLLPFLSSPLFSLIGKLRIAMEIFIPKGTGKTDESAAAFLRRRFGKELLSQVGQALVGGIYMADINLLSTQSALTQFFNLEQEFGSVIKGLLKSTQHNANTASGARYNLFNTLTNGTQMLVDRLTEKLTDVQIHLNTPLLRVQRGQTKNWQLQTNNKLFDADAIVFTLPAKLAAQTLTELDHNLSIALSTIESSNSIVINLLYKTSDIKRPHRGFGFVVPTKEKKEIVATAFISQKFTGRTKPGYEMVRVFLGGQLAPHLFNRSDQELIDIAQQEITNYLKIENPAVQSWVGRCPNGLPFYQVGHKQNVADIENYAHKHPGLFFAGSSYRGVGIPDCVRDAENTAAALAQLIQERNLQCLSETV